MHVLEFAARFADNVIVKDPCSFNLLLSALEAGQGVLAARSEGHPLMLCSNLPLEHLELIVAGDRIEGQLVSLYGLGVFRLRRAKRKEAALDDFLPLGGVFRLVVLDKDLNLTLLTFVMGSLEDAL